MKSRGFEVDKPYEPSKYCPNNKKKGDECCETISNAESLDSELYITSVLKAHEPALYKEPLRPPSNGQRRKGKRIYNKSLEIIKEDKPILGDRWMTESRRAFKKLPTDADCVEGFKNRKNYDLEDPYRSRTNASPQQEYTQWFNHQHERREQFNQKLQNEQNCDNCPYRAQDGSCCQDSSNSSGCCKSNGQCELEKCDSMSQNCYKVTTSCCGDNCECDPCECNEQGICKNSSSEKCYMICCGGKCTCGPNCECSNGNCCQKTSEKQKKPRRKVSKTKKGPSKKSKLPAKKKPSKIQTKSKPKKGSTKKKVSKKTSTPTKESSHQHSAGDSKKPFHNYGWNNRYPVNEKLYMRSYNVLPEDAKQVYPYLKERRDRTHDYDGWKNPSPTGHPPKAMDEEPDVFERENPYKTSHSRSHREQPTKSSRPPRRRNNYMVEVDESIPSSPEAENDESFSSDASSYNNYPASTLKSPPTPCRKGPTSPTSSRFGARSPKSPSSKSQNQPPKEQVLKKNWRVTQCYDEYPDCYPFNIRPEKPTKEQILKANSSQIVFSDAQTSHDLTGDGPHCVYREHGDENLNSSTRLTKEFYRNENPRYYRNLPQKYTAYIRPAGSKVKRGETAASCFHCFD